MILGAFWLCLYFSFIRSRPLVISLVPCGGLGWYMLFCACIVSVRVCPCFILFYFSEYKNKIKKIKKRGNLAVHSIRCALLKLFCCWSFSSRFNHVLVCFRAIQNFLAVPAILIMFWWYHYTTENLSSRV